MLLSDDRQRLATSAKEEGSTAVVVGKEGDASNPASSSDIGASDSPSSSHSYTRVWGWVGGVDTVRDVGSGVGVVRGVRIEGALLENR
jgi:hypothetical protein